MKGYEMLSTTIDHYSGRLSLDIVDKYLANFNV